MGRRMGLAVLSMLGVCGSWRTAHAQSFELADEYDLRAPGLAWTRGDFDADGDLDIAVLTADGSIDVSLNDGHGKFTASAAVTPNIADAQTHPELVAAADFDGDGDADLIVASRVDLPADANDLSPTACSARFFANRGDGTFVAGSLENPVHDPPDPEGVPYVPEEYSCAALNIADYDGDGALDFAVESTSRFFDALVADVNVFPGRADGTFAAPILADLKPSSQAATSDAMASADFDGNGKADIAFGLDQVYLSGSQAHEVKIFALDGAGHLSPTFEQPVFGNRTTFVGARAEDVTGDGRADLLLLPSAEAPGGFELEDLSILLFPNAGDGTLSAPSPVLDEVGGISFESADFDGDMNPDLVLVSELDRAGFALGDGLGNYTKTAEFSTEGLVLASLAGDFDADGRSDLAVLDAARPVFRVALAEASGPGLPLPRVTELGPWNGTFELAPGDYDGDGNLDLLAWEYGAFEVWLGGGDGQFTLGPSIGNNAAPARPLVADLNRDGITDLVVPAPDPGFQTLFGSSDGTFSGANDLDLGEPDSYLDGALGDFDGDGDLDVAAFGFADVDQSGSASPSLAFYTNDGSGHFAPGAEFELTSYPTRLLFADLNADARLDLFVGSSDGSFTYLGDGSGGFTPEPALSAAASAFELGDLNADGALDLVTDAGVALGNGDGTFGALSNANTSSGELALADLDHDGNLDLVVYDSASLRLALGNGDGTFQAATPLLYSSQERALPILDSADFTGDGKPDLFLGRVPNTPYLTSPDSEIVTIVNRTPEPPPSCPFPPPRRPRPHRPPPHWPFPLRHPWHIPRHLGGWGAHR